ncbi:MAG: hypothetical protein E6J15_05220 [Chloroflexi bacterium]|nr:MAG: hypothetical protein E6J15_05220 [Chloroflexota bacterium]
MLRKGYALVTTAVFTAALSVAVGGPARGAIFTVTTTSDSGPGSLRQAILDANAAPGLDTIAFSIAGAAPHTIALLSSLEIDDPVVIDATTEPGFADAPVVELIGTSMDPPDSALLITSGGSTVRGLAIGGFTAAIVINGGRSGNVIAGDYIGTDASGEVALPNSTGVFVSNLSNNRIGGTTAADRNVISGNGDGILMLVHTINNVIQGNYIGTDASGTLRLGNYNGVNFLSGFNTNLVGGSTPGAGNVIAGNNNDGIELNGSAGNTIQGNYIGTNAAGASGLGNANNGVFVNFGCCNLIGGFGPGTRNVISGNGGDGILISHPFLGTTVQGNWIGVAPSGTTTLGNAMYGIDIHATNPSARPDWGDHLFGNVISANGVAGGSGIRIGDGANLTIVVRNLVGTDPTGTAAMSNYGDGVVIDSAPRTAIGGVDAGNTIAFNAGIGVNVLSGTGATISDNSIFANGGLGIDLAPGGVTPNDKRDGDVGANQLQNFPELQSAVSRGTSGTVRGKLDSVPSSSFRIEVFGNAACDPSGNGEGQTFLGAADLTTNNGGNGEFSVTAAFAPGDYITATATDESGNTSEFSGCLLATAPD